MGIADLTAAVHAYSPHSQIALYLSSVAAAILALAAVYLRCLCTGSVSCLQSGWIARTASWAAPIPVFIILMLAPLDDDLFSVLRSDEIVVALAGFYGLVETLKDIREAAANAHLKKNGHHPV